MISRKRKDIISRLFHKETDLLSPGRIIVQNDTKFETDTIVTEGCDQYFVYDLFDKATIGFFKLVIEVNYSVTKSIPKLYLSVEGTYSEATSFYLRAVGNSTYELSFFSLVSFDEFRIDYTDRPNRFRILSAKIERISLYKYTLESIKFLRSNSLSRRKKKGILKRYYWSLFKNKFATELSSYKLNSLQNSITYDTFLEHTDHFDAEEIANSINKFDHNPKISILIPTYNTPLHYFKELVSSIKSQIYTNYEVCIADDFSKNPDLVHFLEQLDKNNDNWSVIFRKENGHISAASNDALALASGEFVFLMDHDDMIHPLALYEIVKAINENRNGKIFFSDEDKIDLQGRRIDPYLKGRWNRDLFYCHNMLTHAICYRNEDMRAVGGFRSEFDGSQDYDLALRILDFVDDHDVIHIPKVLYHWRMLEGSVALGGEQKEYAHDRARKAIQEYFCRNNIPATSVPGLGSFLHNVEYDFKNLAQFSLVICTRDRLDLLQKCVESVLEKTDYPDYEIIIVDNQSKENATLTYLSKLSSNAKIRIVRDEGDFNFSRINNLGVNASKSNYICLLNNDTEVISADWLKYLGMHLQRPEIGIVGAKLLFTNGTIQHAGVGIGMGGVAGHPYSGQPDDTLVNSGKAQLTQRVSAVTGACLATRRDVWESVNGLDETNFAIAYNDVDYCLKAQAAGLGVIYEPRAKLYHHESATRGSDDTPKKIVRFNREKANLVLKWGLKQGCDPYINPNYDHNSSNFKLIG